MAQMPPPHDLDWVDVPLRPRSPSLPAPSTTRKPAVVNPPPVCPTSPLMPATAIALGLVRLLGSGFVRLRRRRRG
jgi:hypothetical protein